MHRRTFSSPRSAARVSVGAAYGLQTMRTSICRRHTPAAGRKVSLAARPGGVVKLNIIPLRDARGLISRTRVPREDGRPRRRLDSWSRSGVALAEAEMTTWHLERARFVARSIAPAIPIPEAPSTSRQLADALKLIGRAGRARELCRPLLLGVALRLTALCRSCRAGSARGEALSHQQTLGAHPVESSADLSCDCGAALHRA